MVLSLMRRHAKSWLIKVLIGIIALVFIFYFGYSFTAKEGLKMAYVNGEVISGMEYRKSYRELLDRVRQQYGRQWNDKLIEVFDLKRRALDNLIDQRLISQEAKRLGLRVTEDEVKQAIMAYAAFQVNGQFSMRRYQSLLQRNRMEPEDFEAAMAQELLYNKLRQFLSAFVPVTDDELKDYYRFDHEKIKVSFVRFGVEEFKEAVRTEVTPEKVNAYFKEHREAYRVPEKIKLAYLEVDPASFEDQVDITDREIRTYYEYEIDKFKEPRQVKARHILFKVGPDAPEEKEKAVRERAEAVLEKAEGEADFSELASEYSEGPSQSKGGDIGYFSKGQMVKPFEEAAFQLEKGEVSDLVRTRFGYHIIKVEDIKPAKTHPLEEVREEIVDTLKANAGKELARERGLSLIDQMPYDIRLVDYAATQEMDVGYTEFFSEEEPIPDLEGSETLRKSLFALQENEISELTHLKDKFYIFQVAERRPAYLPELEEVSDAVKEDLVVQMARKEAREQAEAYLEGLKEGAAWAELAKESGREPKEGGFFSRQEAIPEVGWAPELREELFGLDEDRSYLEEVYENDQGAYVFRWAGYRGIDQEAYEEEKAEARTSLIRQKHMRCFENWLRNLREQGKIEIVTPVSEA